ncbi:MAG: sugar lactone lactonase YvrE [Nitrospinales bacterium]|jgi:sugar lactone lactonase YvrE
MLKKYFYLLTGFALFLGCAFTGTEALAKSLPATKTEISLVDGIAVDKKGNVYIAMRDNNIISRIDLKGIMTTYVGTGSSGFSGDGGKATEAKLSVPAGLAFDKSGNLYIADRNNNRVRKVDTRGTITTIAGTGTAGFSGDGGLATQAQLNLPSGVALDGKGNIFISDRSNNRIRVIDSKGKIRTYAGSGNDGFRGDNGPALKASIDRPFGIALDRKGNLYIADRRNNRVRKVNTQGIITTVAGDGGYFMMGDNGPAYRASIAGPTGVVVDDQGTLYIADRENNRIRAVDSQGMISTVVGTGKQDYNGDSEVARDTNLHLPFGVALNPEGKLLVVDRSHYRIRSIDLKRGSVKTIAGNGKKMFAGDGGPATGATLSFPHGIAVDKNDNVLISDKGNYRIRKISPDGIIHTIAGNGIRGNIGDDMPAMKASIYGATSLKLNNKDEMFILSPSGFVSLIRKIDEKGIMRKFLETVAPRYLKSIANSKYKGKVQTGELAIITTFSDIAFDHKGNMFISDRLNHQIRKVDSKGNISTIAGTGESSHYGDGGPASEAAFRDPSALATDKEGNLYIGDSANNMIRKIDTKGIISTIAGNGKHEATGDGGPAVKAGIRNIDQLAVSPQGEVHIAGMNSNSVRKITKDGKIVTVAGTGYQGYFGDGGPANKAMLKSPVAIAFDSKGNLYITDMGNNRIRKVDTKGIISTFAGTGNFGWAQDGETVEIILHHFP